MDQTPVPSPILGQGAVRLVFREIVQVDQSRGMVPYYHFRIVLSDGTDVGHINFRVGETRHVNLFAGHVGFEVKEEFRGRSYAYQACRALEPFVSTVYSSVIVTCDPENTASRRTIEKLGAVFIEELEVPPDEPMYENGARRKRRYAWNLPNSHPGQIFIAGSNRMA